MYFCSGPFYDSSLVLLSIDFAVYPDLVESVLWKTVDSMPISSVSLFILEEKTEEEGAGCKKDADHKPTVQFFRG